MQFAMKTIRTEDAVGSILCQDITRIVVGKEKGPVFRKGHVVQAEDIPVLLDVGKRNLYVYEPTPGMVHEDDAARRIVNATAGKNLTFTDPKEGRINYKAACEGLLCIDVPVLTAVNSVREISLATLHDGDRVRKGQAVAGTRVVPLVINEEQLKLVEAAAVRPVVEILPFSSPKIGIVTTGSEVYHGRIKDAFGPVLQKKFDDLGCPVAGQTFCDDDSQMIADAILDWAKKGCGMICVTGGMSVDPDDVTPSGIRATGAKIITYGAPVFPGAMFLLSYLQVGDREIPVLGLPGCVMYSKASIFDLIVPRLLAGRSVGAADIAALGHGGYCRGCADCHFPNCGFGRG